MAVLVTCLRRAGFPEDRLGATLTRFGTDHDPVEVPVEVRENPPMLSVPEYRAKLGLEPAA